MGRSIRRPSLVLIATVLVSTSLLACNGTDSNTANSVANDWEVGPPLALPTETPGPVETAAPVPTPTATATPTPTPTPTVSPTPTTSLYTGPADVAKYVQKFVDDAKIQGIDVTPDMSNPKLEIRIASLDAYGSSTIGLCQSSGTMRRVTFDPDFWNSVSETQRELLAHHEFGHCVLYRGHRSDTLATGAYASIMYPIIMSSSTYTNNYDYYQDELFTQGAMAQLDGEVVHVCDLKDLGGAIHASE